MNSRSYPTKVSFKRLDVDGLAEKLTKDASVSEYQYFDGVGIEGIFGAKKVRL
ncbi:hypothetical protein [Alkalicoccobacillus murimartini]|uniref:Uncharacterized protein n=1 Tax=Alkalicoccobacillus murimartini TaxID=171685 RepID=A0ABT9YEV0_9BACI|nr:hypothetical protein [Alkalicoccobacillus murimartini]MDQ0206378.1 hypothetical protein [Alkalicoccobacillus murimartini]